MSPSATSARRRAAFLDTQRRVLERIASAAPLPEVLDTLVRLVEAEVDGLRCAVLLADLSGQRLRFVAAPNIPEDYKKGIEPFLRIAPNMGSCGTAAYLRQPVHTRDTASDPRWKDCGEIAVRNGLRAIWSTPILSDDNAVLGTFAMYYGMPRVPEAEHIQLIDMATQLARVAIEARNVDDALRESEARFRQITENIRDAFWMTTPAMDEVLYVSPAYERIWGRSLESLRARPRSFIDAIHPDDRDGVVGLLESRREQGFEVVYRLIRPDGSMRWIRDRGFPVRNGSAEVYRVAGIAEDITEHKQAEEALRRSESELAEAQRVAQLGSWTFDVATDTVRWSEELYRIFDVDKTAFTGSYENFLSRVHPEDRARALQANAAARSQGGSFQVEYRIMTRSGRLKHIREVGYARKDAAGAVAELFGTAQDISARKEAEQALRAAAHELQALSRRLVEVQEGERKALARELHDRIGQSLTALSINLGVLRQALASGANHSTRSRLEDSAALVEATSHAITNVIADLRPPMLDDHGLEAALRWYAQQFSSRTGMTISVNASAADTRAPAEVELALFRIAQEALNNVAKHARATKVVITLGRATPDYVMSVADDGIGFRSVAGSGLGMVTMRERAQAVGGRFEVVAPEGSGTWLAVRVPS